MISIIKNILFVNWQAKLFCLFAASLLWFYVASSLQTTAKFPGDIKIRAINASSDLIPIYDESTVEIKVMAKQSDWQKLSAASFSANIDLAGLTAGTHEVDVHVVSTVSGITIVEISPSRILVSLDPLITKEVPVSKKIEGNAADGMVAGTVDFTPKTVQIKGAKSLIENIEEVSGSILLEGQSAGFQQRVSLSVYNVEGKAVEGIEITPSEVEANISIVKGSNVKTLGIKPKIIGNPGAGYYISSISVDPSVVEVTGPRNTINDTKYLETTAINISGLSSSFDREVSLEVPVDLTVINSSLTKVKVVVTILSLEITQEVTVDSFNPSNLAGEISSYSPASVKLSVRGSAAAIASLEQTIALNYDFKALSKIDDHTYILQVTAEQFNLPATISVLSIDPVSVLVKTK